MAINKEFRVKHGLISEGDVQVNGSVIATSFIGDGSQLTGISSFSGNYNDLTNKPNLVKAAVEWSPNHTLADGTRYLAGDVVWDNGNVYVANYDNESLPTSNTLYWTNLGPGNRLNIDGRDIPNISYTQLSNTPSFATVATSGSYNDLTNKPTNISSFINDSGYLTSVSAGSLTGTTLNSTIVNSSLTSVGTLTSLNTSGSVTANASTAFIAGANAISNIALQMPSESAIRNLTNGTTNMYFDVSIGGSTQGQFQFRSSSSYTNILTMSSTGVSFNTDATFTSRTPSLARTAFNSAIDTEITVDNMRFRISNQGGIFPQVIGNGSSRNLAWTGVGAISGTAVTQVGSTGTIVASNAWTTLYNAHGMDSAGDTITVTLQDKAGSRIYRVTFMRSDNGSTTGYNIIAERIL